MATRDTIEEAKVHELLGHVVGDLAGSVTATMVFFGDRLGLYQAIADAGTVTSSELAEKTGTAERYVRDWLVNQAAGGYIEYDATTGRYSLSPEQREAFTNSDSPFFVPGGFQIMHALSQSATRILENFRTGAGMAWGEHDANLFEGTERFFKPGYMGSLVQAWLPALEGAVEKLERGASVADVGCGHGASTIILAQAYPNSRFTGFDLHGPSIERARTLAAEAGVGDRTTFEVASSDSFPGEGYDLIAFFDCLHDMPHPEAAARRAAETLKPDGHVLLVEPMAGRTVEENFNPVGRMFAAASALVCTQNAVAGGGTGIGTIATDDDLKQVFTKAGFSRFRRATETPFNRIFEARP
jgi:2-polyprenyl-3-methyl-5-hydroxy-6-metoxy-1,4-benzoquinol methylase